MHILRNAFGHQGADSLEPKSCELKCTVFASVQRICMLNRRAVIMKGSVNMET